ncbi:hypothetical protein GGI43DRAFT_89371 [Trichoderma evansii]
MLCRAPNAATSSYKLRAQPIRELVIESSGNRFCTTGRLFSARSNSQQLWVLGSSAPKKTLIANLQLGVYRGQKEHATILFSKHHSQPIPLTPGDCPVMTPHLHPRSRMTSSIFATTLIASFFVVALPHLLPCPVPRTKYADGEIIVDENGRRKRWRSREAIVAKDGLVQFNQTTDNDFEQAEERAKRECPVPKPGGMLGEWLGFHATNDNTRASR